MMVDKLIEPDSLRATQKGFSVGVRLPWYRTVPLSTVELVSLKLDEHAIDAGQIRFAINGGEWKLEELPALTEEQWFVIDTADLRVIDQQVERGSEHDVEVVLAVYPPYIKGLRRLLRWSRRMKVN
jgi:uncharacterized protein DUF6379